MDFTNNLNAVLSRTAFLSLFVGEAMTCLMQKKYLQVATVLALTMCHGCSEPTAGREKISERTISRELGSFPKSDRMLLGEYQAQLKPLISIPLTAPADGNILFYVTQTRQKLTKDTLWAEVNPAQLASGRKELELNILKEELRLREEIQNAARELVRVECMLNDPALRELPYEDRIPVSTNLVEQLHEEKKLLEEQLTLCGVIERLNFEQKSRRSKLVMPFDGELLIYLPASEERAEFRIAAGTPIGMMRDVSELHLHLAIRDPQIASIPPQQLSVKFKRDADPVFHGTFFDSQVLEIHQQNVLIYRFSFAPKEIKRLTSLIGANLTCELWVQSDQSFHVVSKIELACMTGEKGSFAGWEGTISPIWPTAKILYSGRTHLGITTTEAEK